MTVSPTCMHCSTYMQYLCRPGGGTELLEPQIQNAVSRHVGAPAGSSARAASTRNH